MTNEKSQMNNNKDVEATLQTVGIEPSVRREGEIRKRYSLE